MIDFNENEVIKFAKEYAGSKNGNYNVTWNSIASNYMRYYQHRDPRNFPKEVKSLASKIRNNVYRLIEKDNVTIDDKLFNAIKEKSINNATNSTYSSGSKTIEKFEEFEKKRNKVHSEQLDEFTILLKNTPLNSLENELARIQYEYESYDSIHSSDYPKEILQIRMVQLKTVISQKKQTVN